MVVLVLLAAGCRAEDSTSPPPVVQTADDVPSAAKAAPRWERVVTFAGTGDQRTAKFEIGAGALQWRVDVSCTDGGAMRVGLDGDPSVLVALDDCPAKGFGFSIRTGPGVLDVDATGRWEIVVDQQVDTAVAEPALAGMTDGSRLAHGDFYGIDQDGSGTASLYRLPGGGMALRFFPFLVTRNSDLFVWVSEAPAPRTSEEALRTPHVQIDRLTATAGGQNYELPDSVDLDKVRSVVIWCEPVRTAYAAATLVR
jgi:hypothetical protein